MRLDQRLVAEGLAESRARAQALIRSGAVMVDGAPVLKPAATPPPAATLTLGEDPCPWVSRAALKLAHAIQLWGLDPTGATALDVGASTGGFTEVLLAHGAKAVHALDVGHGQLNPRIAADPRVTNHEGINARALPPGLIPPVDWIVSDVSFIGLAKALPAPLSHARPGATLVALIKPQFEVGPAHVGRGGIVRDDAIRQKARDDIRCWLSGIGWAITGEAESPITGSDGNHEYLITAKGPGA